MSSILARTSVNCSRFICIGTHADRLASRTEQMAILENVSSQIRTRFQLPHLVCFPINSTAEGDQAMASLRSCLLELARSNTPMVPACLSHARTVVDKLACELHPPFISLAALESRIQTHFTSLKISWNEKVHFVLEALELLGSIVIVRTFTNQAVEQALLSTQWVARLFSSVVTTRHNYINSTDAILHQDSLVHIWNDHQRYPPTLHQTMLDILFKFDVIFPLDHQDMIPRRYLVPCLLSEESPDQSFVWPSDVLRYSLSRLFHLDDICPIGLMPRLVGYLTSVYRTRLIWQKGCIVQFAHRSDALIRVHQSSPTKVLMEIIRPVQETLQLVSELARLIRHLTSLVTVILTDFYHVKFTILVPCIGNSLLAAGNSGCAFSVESILSDVSQNESTTRCSKYPDPHIAPISKIAPDLAFLDIFQQAHLAIPWQAINLGPELGKGAYGRVVHATVIHESVSSEAAVKIIEEGNNSSTSLQSILYPSTSSSISSLTPSLSSSSSSSPSSHVLAAVLEEFHHEVFILSLLNHPNIVRLLGMALNPLAIIMEVLPAENLYTQLTNPFKLKELNDLINDAKRLVSISVLQREPSVELDNLDQGELYLKVRSKFDLLKRSLSSCAQLAMEVEALQTKAVHALQEFCIGPQTRALDDALTLCQEQIQNFLDEQREFIAPIPKLIRYQVTAEIASGLLYMHSQTPPILHRDLKSPNIFLKCSLIGLERSQSTISESLSKIGDFGLSIQMIGTTQLRVNDEHEALKGLLPTWAAPEVLHGQGYSLPSDVYSFGIILWELAARRHPFQGVSEILLSGYIQAGHRPSIPTGVHPLYESLIQSCWANNPAERPSFAEIGFRLIDLFRIDAPELADRFSSSLVLPRQLSKFQHSSSETSENLNNYVLLDRLKVPIPQWLEPSPSSSSLTAVYPQAEISRSRSRSSLFSKRYNMRTNLRTASMGSLPASPTSPTDLSNVTMKIRSMCLAHSHLLWMGFRNGSLSVLDIADLIKGEHSLKKTAMYIFASPITTTPSSVDALEFTMSHLGQVWSGSASGRLAVWSGSPKSAIDLYESTQLKGYVELMIKKKWVSRWCVLESGIMRIYEGRITGKETISFRLQPEQRSSLNLFLDTSTPDSPTLHISNYLIRSQSETENALSVESLFHSCQICLSASESSLSLVLLTATNIAAPITSLRAIQSSMWSTSLDLVVCEWESKQYVDQTGLRPDQQLITPLRRIDMPYAMLEAKFRVISSLLQIDREHVWCAFGNRLITIDISTKSPKILQTSHPLDLEHRGLITQLMPVTCERSSSVDSVGSIEVWSADNMGEVRIWHIDAGTKYPILRHSFQVNDGIIASCAVVSTEVWIGLNDGSIIRYNAASRQQIVAQAAQTAHQDSVSSIVLLSKQPPLICASSWDQSISLWGAPFQLSQDKISYRI